MIDHDQNIRDERKFAENCTVDVLATTRIPHEEYRKHPGLNQSYLRKVLELGLERATYERDNPDEPTDDMILGSVHHAYLSRHMDIIHSFERAPKVDRRTKEGKAVWQTLMDGLKPGVTLVRDEIWDKAHLLAHKAQEVREQVLGIKEYTTDMTEVSLVARVRFKTEELTLDCDIKGQLDLVYQKDKDSPVLVVDYKTSSSCAEIPVLRKSRDSMWALQAYTYCTLAAAHYKAPASAYYIVSSKDHENARAYSFGQNSMITGRHALASAVYRKMTQKGTDAEYTGITLL